MQDIKKPSMIALMIMAIMAIVSFTNLFGLNLSSAAIIIGVIFFFINNLIEKQPTSGSGLDLKAIGTNLKDKKIWVWLLLPIVMDAVCVVLSLLFLPEYIEYETARAGSFVPIEISVSSLLMFFVFALGEEIAWRAFFQNKLSKIVPTGLALLITSLLFTLGHFHQGNTVVVIFGLIFTFINSILYGVIFHKTKNAWVSTLSHYVANIFEVVLFLLI
jgi:membrane protease YdiL (CAAX protease family)